MEKCEREEVTFSQNRKGEVPEVAWTGAFWKQKRTSVQLQQSKWERDSDAFSGHDRVWILFNG